MRIYILLIALLFIGGLLTGCGVSGYAQKTTPPFSIDKRPQPVGSDLEILLPQTVGTFKRDVISGNSNPFSGEDVNVQYSSGNDTIFFGFSIVATEKDASEAIKMTRKEAIESRISIKDEQYVIGQNPSYFKIAGFMSWTRGKYFFYAKANNPQALEKFMKDFSY